MPFGGRTYDPGIDGPWMKTQLYHVFAIMRDSRWRTPYQMMDDIRDQFGVSYPGTAAITARARDFRKPEFGKHTVDIRRVAPGSSIYEYQLIPNQKSIKILFDRWINRRKKKKKDK